MIVPPSRILVVEDNPVTRKAVCVALSAEGFAVLAAENGAQALAHMADGSIDLVLQDLNLPDIDGCELLPRLRAAAAANIPPILALSGMAHEERAAGAGFTELLVKPIEPSRLVEVVRTFLARGEVVPGSPGRGRTVLVVDDDPVQLRLQKVQLEQLGFRVETAPNGIEAIRRLRGEPPAAIVSDVFMSRMDGFELCRAIRTDPRLYGIPVLLVSAKEFPPDESSLAYRLGADATLFRTADHKAVADALVAALDGEPQDTLDFAPTQRLQPVVAEGVHRRDRMWRAVLALLARLADVASRPLSVDDVIGDVLASFLDACGCPIGAAYLVEPDGKLAPHAHLGLTPSAAMGLPDFFGHVGWLHRVLRIRETVTLCHCEKVPGMNALLDAIGAKSLLLAPIVLGDERLGVVVIASLCVEVPDDWVALATAVSGPIAKSVALARTVARLAQSEHRFRSIAEATADGIVVADMRGDIVYANPAARELTDRTDAELKDCSIGEILPFLRRSGSTQDATVTRRDGRDVPVEITVRAFEDPPGCPQHVYVLRDLSDRYRMDELVHLATRDSLTGLFNRRRFQEDVLVRLAESRRYGSSGALLVLDLDGFKSINDTCGHLAGDAVLKAVGQLLRRITRESDVAARIGGDEFVVLLPRATSQQALACAEKILNGMNGLRVSSGGRTIRVATSIGISVFPDHGPTAEDLFAAADSALYRAKQAGRSRICLAGPREPSTSSSST